MPKPLIELPIGVQETFHSILLQIRKINSEYPGMVKEVPPSQPNAHFEIVNIRGKHKWYFSISGGIYDRNNRGIFFTTNFMPSSPLDIRPHSESRNHTNLIKRYREWIDLVKRYRFDWEEILNTEYDPVIYPMLQIHEPEADVEPFKDDQQQAILEFLIVIEKLATDEEKAITQEYLQKILGVKETITIKPKNSVMKEISLIIAMAIRFKGPAALKYVFDSIAQDKIKDAFYHVIDQIHRILPPGSS